MLQNAALDMPKTMKDCKHNIELLQLSLIMSVYFKKEINCVSVSKTKTDVFNAIVLRCSR